MFEGDITHFEISGSFNLVTMNDVLEHVQPSRHHCLIQRLVQVTAPGSFVYFHTPTPETQLHNAVQFYENVVPTHYWINQMARGGFQLERMEYDTDLDCGKNNHGKLAGIQRTGAAATARAKCVVDGVPKYTHMLFRRTADERVFRSKTQSRQL